MIAVSYTGFQCHVSCARFDLVKCKTAEPHTALYVIDFVGLVTFWTYYAK